MLPLSLRRPALAVGCLLAVAGCEKPSPEAAAAVAGPTIAAAPVPAAAAAAAAAQAPAEVPVAAAAVAGAPGDGAPAAAGPACVGGTGPGCGQHQDPAPVVGAVPAATGAALTLPGTVYGAGVTVTETTPISQLLATPDAFAGKRVRVEGLVADVCEMRGCWMNLASDKEFQTMKFKVTDGVIVIPTSARGKYAVAEGTVRKMPLTLEQTRKMMAHEAEEQRKAFDPATVTEAVTMVRLDGLGAVIRDAK